MLARHAWADGSTLDLFADPARSEAAVAAFAGDAAATELRAFTAEARLLFEAFEGPVMRNPRPTPLGVAAAVAKDARRLLPAIAPQATLWDAVTRRFTDPRLRQLFARYATYVGGSPFLSPAILTLIWRAEAAGVWYVDGGMAALAQAIADLATARGAEIRLGAAVRSIDRARGRTAAVTLEDGATLPADAVVFNGDPSALGAGLLGAGVAEAAPQLRAGGAVAVGLGLDLRRRGRRGLRSTIIRCSSATTTAPSSTTCSPRAACRGRRRSISVRRTACRGARRPTAPERLMMIMNAPADGDQGGALARGDRDMPDAGFRPAGPDGPEPDAAGAGGADDAGGFRAGCSRGRAGRSTARPRTGRWRRSGGR